MYLQSHHTEHTCISTTGQLLQDYTTKKRSPYCMRPILHAAHIARGPYCTRPILPRGPYCHAAHIARGPYCTRQIANHSTNMAA